MRSYMPSCVQGNTNGGMTSSQNTALQGRTAALRAYVNEQGGSLIVLTQAGQNAPYGFLPQPLTFVRANFIDVTITGNMISMSPDTDSANLDHDAWHGWFTGPTNYGGIFQVLVREWCATFLSVYAAHDCMGVCTQGLVVPLPQLVSSPR
jgi:hypothetical protein